MRAKKKWRTPTTIRWFCRYSNSHPCARLFIMKAMAPPGSKALRKGRVSQVNRIYLITVVTESRRKWFRQHDLARQVARCLGNDPALYDARVLCWVVMPDHVHVLLELGQTPLQKVINQWKSRTGRLLNTQIGRKGRFWQKGYHDHALRREEDLKDVARYIIGNPLRAGLSKKYGHYPYWNAVWL